MFQGTFNEVLIFNLVEIKSDVKNFLSALQIIAPLFIRH